MNDLHNSRRHRLLEKMTRQAFLFVLFLVCMALPIQSFGGDDGWEAVCKDAERIPLPAKDRPDANSAKALAGCESANLYYGFDITPDPVKARHCAYLEMDRGDEHVFGGSAILMMIYANGKGVKKNPDAAIKFACKLEGAPAEMRYRIQHLVDLKEGSDGKPFDLCDDITSGYMQGHCAGREQRFADAKLKRKVDGILAKWSERDKQGFALLRHSFEKFSEARIRNEVDTTGTARAALQIEEESKLSKDFVTSIMRFEKGKLPHFTNAEFTKADRELNEVYGKIQGQKDFQWGSVTKPGIKLTQRIWLKYREAWVTFGHLRYPQVSEESWRTWLTKKRIAMLKEYLD
ncbi:DUF1311 domain-containing protein [Geomonas sp. Red32]|uniref:lysozyme inhibitor LprI family protein n=1 Tax=Geomonas sp. Red32 TaxID=2912856 RepID=UPI00202CF281|nr:lysozyme inhibitor LprI family protein [Geomonas sp. Red32]MCM0080345.1 DUF1311 domain-containing protein [Geomonas sp. Red32]